jgi:hypothetical protein
VQRYVLEQVRDLVAYLSDTMDPNHSFAQVHAGPGACDTMPEVWLLGSRYESAHIAAQFGLPCSYAQFFSIAVQEGPTIVERYRRNFRPSVYSSAPKVNVAVTWCVLGPFVDSVSEYPRSKPPNSTRTRQTSWLTFVSSAPHISMGTRNRSKRDSNLSPLPYGIAALSESSVTTCVSLREACRGLAELQSAHIQSHNVLIESSEAAFSPWYTYCLCLLMEENVVRRAQHMAAQMFMSGIMLGFLLGVLVCYASFQWLWQQRRRRRKRQIDRLAEDFQTLFRQIDADKDQSD